jgi:predicted glycoside hydrolase/deacetylase ChbG (UPF0249 family)
MQRLIISADDYGYSAGYDEGILEAAAAGAVDAVSVMVRRGRVETMPLLLTGVEVGLHLELAADAARRAVVGQIERFEELFGRPPAFLDGHHHCHAAPGIALIVGQAAAERRTPVRSVSPDHRRLLRRLGVRTPDLLVGRLRETEPATPVEIQAVLMGDRPTGARVVEWMVHPGHGDRASGSSFDAGRVQDLRLLLDLVDAGSLRDLRATHAAALG